MYIGEINNKYEIYENAAAELLNIHRTNNNNNNWDYDNKDPKLPDDIIYEIIDQFPKDAKKELLPLRLVSKVFRDAVDHRLFAGTWTTFAENCPKEKHGSFKNPFAFYIKMTDLLMPKNSPIQKFAKFTKIFCSQEHIFCPQQMKLPLTIADYTTFEHRKITTDNALCNLGKHLIYSNAEEIIKYTKATPTAAKIRCLMDTQIYNDKLKQINGLNMSASSRNDLRNGDTIPPEILYFTEVKSLSWEYSLLPEIPDEIGHLKQLETLFLKTNKIHKIPATLGNLTRLQILDLRNNEITEIPDNLGNLIKLRILVLSNNQITEIPIKIIKNLTQLQSLDVTYNNINNSNTIALKQQGTRQGIKRLYCFPQSAEMAFPQIGNRR